LVNPNPPPGTVALFESPAGQHAGPKLLGAQAPRNRYHPGRPIRWNILYDVLASGLTAALIKTVAVALYGSGTSAKPIGSAMTAANAAMLT